MSAERRRLLGLKHRAAISLVHFASIESWSCTQHWKVESKWFRCQTGLTIIYACVFFLGKLTRRSEIKAFCRAQSATANNSELDLKRGETLNRKQDRKNRNPLQNLWPLSRNNYWQWQKGSIVKAHAAQVICETDELTRKWEMWLEFLQHYMKNGRFQVRENNTEPPRESLDDLCHSQWRRKLKNKRKTHRTPSLSLLRNADKK